MNTNNIEQIIAAAKDHDGGKLRIIQELVPGKQITLAHIIANPDTELHKKLGLDPRIDYSHSAIGVLTVSPAETAIIAADISMKASGIELEPLRPEDLHPRSELVRGAPTVKGA